MKYIKLYEDMSTYHNINGMIQYIRDKLNIIGIDIDQNDPIERMHGDIFKIKIKYNINGVKNSLLSIFSKYILMHYNEPLNSGIFMVTDHVDVLQTQEIKTLELNLDTSKSIDDIYITIMNNILNNIKDVGNAIRIKNTTFNIRDFLANVMIKTLKMFIEDNIYYKMNEVNISDKLIEYLFEMLSYMDSKYAIINDIKNYQSLIYNKFLNRYGDQINKSANLGEMGFSD